MAIAELLVLAMEIYAAFGVLFAAAFHVRGLGKLDPSALGTGTGFRLMITPGIVALWPLLLRRWMQAGK